MMRHLEPVLFSIPVSSLDFIATLVWVFRRWDPLLLLRRLRVQ